MKISVGQPMKSSAGLGPLSGCFIQPDRGPSTGTEYILHSELLVSDSKNIHSVSYS